MSQKSLHFYQCKQCRASSARTFETDFTMWRKKHRLGYKSEQYILKCLADMYIASTYSVCYLHGYLRSEAAYSVICAHQKRWAIPLAKNINILQPEENSRQTLVSREMTRAGNRGVRVSVFSFKSCDSQLSVDQIRRNLVHFELDLRSLVPPKIFQICPQTAKKTQLLH